MVMFKNNVGISIIFVNMEIQSILKGLTISEKGQLYNFLKKDLEFISQLDKVKTNLNKEKSYYALIVRVQRFMDMVHIKGVSVINVRSVT